MGSWTSSRAWKPSSYLPHPAASCNPEDVHFHLGLLLFSSGFISFAVVDSFLYRLLEMIKLEGLEGKAFKACSKKSEVRAEGQGYTPGGRAGGGSGMLELTAANSEPHKETLTDSIWFPKLVMWRHWGTLRHDKWGCSLAQPFGKLVWQYLVLLKIYMLCDPDHPSWKFALEKWGPRTSGTCNKNAPGCIVCNSPKQEIIQKSIKWKMVQL